MITKLAPNEIFVFGSNLRGIHGAGAAKQAHQQFDAAWGCAEGLTGQCYAIPTKANPFISLNLDTISRNVRKFRLYAESRADLRFMLTVIGCGHAGYQPHQIGPMFDGCGNNVILPEEFRPFCGQD